MCHEWISAGIGLWLLASAFALATGDRVDLINGLLAGTILICVGVYAGLSHGRWHDWIISGLGVWMIVSGKIMPKTYRIRSINYIFAALVVMVVGSWHCYF
jgi:hypothetical protein